jgi:predicted nucleic acid-binding protein
MGMRTTYPDANVILYVFSENEIRMQRARAIFEDMTRTLVTSDYLWLETMPKMIYSKRDAQVKYTKGLFRRSKCVPLSDAIVTQAKELAATYGLAGMDALHVACAISGGAGELVTFEKPTKPFFRVPPNVLRITSLYDVG